MEVPGTSVRWVEEPADVPAALATLFELHARRFADKGEHTKFSGAALRAFHTRYAEELASRNELVLGILERDGRPLAGVYGFRCHGATGLFQSGFDPAPDAAGTSEALRILLLKNQAADPTQRELDLLDGCYPWKLRLASGVRRQFDVDLYPQTVRGFLAWGLRKAWRTLKQRVASLLRKRACPGECGAVINPAHCRRAGCPDADVHHPRAA